MRYGGDPLPHLDPAPIRANRHLGPGATPDNARKVLIEELERHEALSERTLEIEESCREVETVNVDIESTVVDPLTVRLRAATESEFNANTRPLEEGGSSDEAERAEFADKVRMPATRESRRPRKR